MSGHDPGDPMGSGSTPSEVRRVDGREFAYRRELPDHLAEAIRAGRGWTAWSRVARFSGVSVSMLKDLARGVHVHSHSTLDRLEAAGFKLAPEAWLRSLASPIRE